MAETIKQPKELSDSVNLGILTALTFGIPIVLSGMLTSIIFVIKIIRKYNFLDTNNISGFDAMTFAMWIFMIYFLTNLLSNIIEYQDELQLKPFCDKPEHKLFINILSVILVVLGILVTIIFYIGQKVIR